MPDQSLVFIHGFGSKVDVWAKLIRLIHADPYLSGMRIFTFGYPSPKKPRRPLSSTRIPDYSDIAQVLESYLDDEVPDNVAIVTHSQGGLILQRFLVRMLDDGRGLELARIRLIVMLACPNLGSEYLGPLRTAAGSRRHPQARELHPLNIHVTEARRRC